MDELDARLGDYQNPLAITARLDLDASGQEGDCIIELAEEPPVIPPDLLVLIGIVLYNLRSALDYLAHEMTAVGKGRLEESQWPIADDSSRLKRSDKKTLQHLTTKHRALVERLQPYDGRNVHFAVLRELSNRYKHRLLVATVQQLNFEMGMLDLVTLLDCRGDFGRTWVEVGALKSGAPLMRYPSESPARTRACA